MNMQNFFPAESPLNARARPWDSEAPSQEDRRVPFLAQSQLTETLRRSNRSKKLLLNGIFNVPVFAVGMGAASFLRRSLKKYSLSDWHQPGGRTARALFGHRPNYYSNMSYLKCQNTFYLFHYYNTTPHPLPLTQPPDHLKFLKNRHCMRGILQLIGQILPGPVLIMFPVFP